MDMNGLFRSFSFSITFARMIFFFCSFYFFVMGLALILVPELLVKGVAGEEVNPTIIGMLRGAGGSILPYSILYIFVAWKPKERAWAFYVIGTANVLAIILDFSSVVLGEYEFSFAMYDVPVELLSLIAIFIYISQNLYPKK